MKTERLQLLMTPEFKTFLGKEAKREGVSVAELVRSRCERRPSDEEARLAELTAELRKSITEAQGSLHQGLKEANKVLAELRSKRAKPTKAIGNHV